MRVQEVAIERNGREMVRYVVVDSSGQIMPPIARYLKFLDSAGRARLTLRSYAHHLRLYFEFLDQHQRDYREVTLDDLGAYVLWLKNPYRSTELLPRVATEQVRSNVTINKAISVVTGFYDYLWRKEELSSDLASKTRIAVFQRGRSFKGFLHHAAHGKPVQVGLLRQKVPKRKVKTLAKSQIETLVAACNNERDRLLLSLLFESGLRVGEALALWVEDIDIPRRKLHVRDRGELENGAEIKTPAACRSVDVSAELINLILNYLAVAHTDEVDTNHLFIKLSGPNAGKPLSYPEVNDLFLRLSRKTGVKASAHMLRHSLMTSLARAGWQPEHLRVRAGHANFQTTYQMYVHPDEDDIRADWERTEERIRLKRPGK